MEMKEAIKVLKNRNEHKLYRYSAHNIEELNEAVDILIELSERGEKFEKMWREFENKDLTYKSDSPVINDEMYYIEQKYFPKPEKNPLERYIRKEKGKMNIEEAIHFVKGFNISHNKERKENIKQLIKVLERGREIEQIEEDIDNLKVKYFTKSIRKNITIEIKAKDNFEMGHMITAIERLVHSCIAMKIKRDN